MALTKITSTNIGANAVTSTALNLTTLAAGNTVITGTASVSTTLSAGNTTITGFANVTGAGSGTFTPYNDPLVVKGTDYTYLHLKGTNNQAAVIYNRNGTTGWFHGLDNSGNMKLVAMAAMDGTGLGNAKDGTAAMLVDTSGRVTMPYQPAFHAYPAGNPTFTADGGTSSPMAGSTFDTTEFNVGSHFSTSTSRFTAPIAGRYWFAFQLSCGTDPGTVQEAKLYINGTERRRAYYRAGTNITANESNVVTAILNLSAGDYVQCGVYTNSAFTLMGGQSGGQAHFTYFCGYLLG